MRLTNSTSASARLAGHATTVWAPIRGGLFPPAPPPSQGWEMTVRDPDVGEIRLSGQLSRPTGARDAVVLLHGLGGSSESAYMARAARAAADLNLASLRLNLRGAAGTAGDIYHGGLTADLHAVSTDLAADGFERLFVLGFSLGGHVALRFATETGNQNVAAVATVCSPLDLAVGSRALDRPHMWPYRSYVLRSLKANYRITETLGAVPIPWRELRKVRTIRQWDSQTVVPRFGFDDADDYYRKASVSGRLDDLRCPARLLAVENDPMIPPAAIRPALQETSSKLLAARWLPRGGHIGFASNFDLGFEGARGLEPQMLRWLLSAAA